MDAGSVLDLQHVRASFLDHVSAAEGSRRARTPRRRSRAKARPRTGVISHEMSRRYQLEHPVDDPDEDDEDDDFDEDDDGDDDEDGDEEEVETWQVSNCDVSAKVHAPLDFGN